MNNIEQLVSLLTNTWAKKTLEELRIEAEREVTGIAFESIRESGGQRFMIVLCATDIDQIAKLETALNLIDDGVLEDWSTVTLAELAIRLIRNGGGLRFESIRDEYARRSAVALLAADPASVRKVEKIFNMPM